jgi:putative nucleotidyltransferase with HDIG domain
MLPGIDDIVAGDPRIGEQLVRLRRHHEPTYHHSLRVGSLVRDMSVRSHIQGRLPYAIENAVPPVIAALLHDVGKRAVPTSVLDKRTPLTITERDRLQEHVQVSCNELRDAGFPVDIIGIVGEHHYVNRYPPRVTLPNDRRGHTPEDIKYWRHVLAVADNFDALTDPDRPYRTPLMPAAALDAIRTVFGPSETVDSLAAVIARR